MLIDHPVKLAFAIMGVALLLGFSFRQHSDCANSRESNEERGNKQNSPDKLIPSSISPSDQARASEQSQTCRSAEESNSFLGISYGEWLIAFVTLLLWIATMQLVVDARNTAKRQLRAYISADTGESYSKTGDFVKEQAIPTVHNVIIKNCGLTPAHRVRYWGMMQIKEYPMKWPPQEPADPQFQYCLLHPGQEKILPVDMPLGHDERNAILSGEWALYFWGKIFYEDAFGEERRTEFVFFIEKSALDFNRWGAYGRGNEAT